jgi:hypothetical protein
MCICISIHNDGGGQNLKGPSVASFNKEQVVMNICIYIYIYVCMHIFISMYMYVYIYIYIYMYVHMYI